MHLRNWFRACRDMNDVYVSFELAKLLKEKGFKEKCKYFYEWRGDTEEPLFYYLDGGTCNDDDCPSRYSVPLVWKVKRWLRNKHDIYTSTASCKDGYSTDINTKYYSVKLCSDLSYEDHTELVLKYILKKLI